MKKVLIILSTTLGILIAIYLGFSIYFLNHFCFKTFLNGSDVSGYSSEKIHNNWNDSIKEYKLTINERNNTTDILKGSDIGLELHWDDSVQELINSQNAFTWITSLFIPSEYSCDTIVSFDQIKLNTAAHKLNCMSPQMQVMPIDATISDYDTTNGFSLVPSIVGTAIDENTFLSGLDQKILGLAESYSIEEDGGYIPPAIDDDNEELLKTIELFNKYGKAQITYQVGDDEWTLDATTYLDWLIFDKNDRLTSIDEEKVNEYVDALAQKYNTCFSAKTLKTSYGQTVTIQNSHYGWKVDTEAEALAIIDAIQNGTRETRDLNYSMTANSHSGNDYGDSYVEINLTAQHLFLYKDGQKIFETDFVSGNPSKGNATPPGAFGITYTQKDAVLRGDDYETPVSYWMPFNGNIGLHDASWRGVFGGTIYKTGGSHGCVNLPPASAKTIFEVVCKNYPVLAYELPGTERPSKYVPSNNKKKEEPKKDDKKKKDSKKKDTKKKDSKSKDTKKKDSKKKDSKKKNS